MDKQNDNVEEIMLADVGSNLTKGVYLHDCTANKKRIIRRKANRYRLLNI